MRQKGWPLLAAIIFFAAGTHASAQTVPAPAQRLDAVVTSAMRRAPIEGVAVAVSRGGAVVTEAGYGRADAESGQAVTDHTVFEIGSITKQFTAAAILKLAEDGRLRLEDAIGTYLPELRTRAEGVTLRHLLTHTSGLSSAWAVSDLTAPASPRVVVDSLAARALEFAPGERFVYNNNGYILLGQVVERVSGMSYTDYVRTRLVEPLGLSSVAPCDQFPAARRAKGYEHPVRGPLVASPAAAHHPTVTSAAGMLCATAGDLLRWEIALASGAIVRPEDYALMTRRTVLASGREVPYGMGMQHYTWEDRPAIGHSGGTPGFISEIVHVPGDSLTVVVLTNGVYAGQIVRNMAYDVLRAVAGLPGDAMIDQPTTPDERALYVGTYDLGPVQIAVYEQEGYLRALPPGQVAARLLYQGDGVFRAEHDTALHLRFVREGGQVTAVVIEQGGRSMPPAKRLR